MSSNAQSANSAFALSATLENGHLVNAKHAKLERRSAHQLRLKAVEMLRSSTQVVKSHGEINGKLEFSSEERW